MKKLVIKAALISTLVLAGNAHAETTTGNASATILGTITFVEDAAIAYGSIPFVSSGTCTMAAAGALSGDCTGTGTAGAFTVTGTNGEGAAISVSAGTTVDGVVFAPTLLSSATDTFNGSDEISVSVGGSLTYPASSVSGVKNFTYTLTVNYN